MIFTALFFLIGLGVLAFVFSYKSGERDLSDALLFIASVLLVFAGLGLLLSGLARLQRLLNYINGDV